MKRLYILGMLLMANLSSVAQKKISLLSQFTYSGNDQKTWALSSKEENLILSQDTFAALFSATNTITTDGENLLFYFNGTDLYHQANKNKINANKFGLEKGFVDSIDLLGSPLPHSAVFVDHPEDSNILILLHADASKDNIGNRKYSHLFYSLIDKKNKTVLNQNIIVTVGDFSNFTVLPHSNGFDYWMFVIDYENKKMNEYLISKEGLKLHAALKINIFNKLDSNSRGLLLSNEHSSYLAYHNILEGLTTYKIDLCNGKIMQTYTIPNSGSYFTNSSFDFSSDGKFIILNKLAHNNGIDVFHENIKQLEIYDIERLGLDINPKWVIPLADNFTPGQVLGFSDGYIFILSKIISKRYLVIKINADKTLDVYSKTLPFKYIPSKSLVVISNNDVNGCLSDNIEIKYNENLILYPNPVFSELNISTENQSIISIDELCIFDVFGKKQPIGEIRKNGSTITLSIENLNSGLYFVKNKNDKYYGKFIKI